MSTRVSILCTFLWSESRLLLNTDMVIPKRTRTPFSADIRRPDNLALVSVLVPRQQMIAFFVSEGWGGETTPLISSVKISRPNFDSVYFQGAAH